MATLLANVNALRVGLEADRQTNIERRKVDDARYEGMSARLDAHGLRQTTSDTRWEAFFGEQGAFRLFIKKVDAHDAKLDTVLDGQNRLAGAVATAKWAIPLMVSGVAGLVGAIVWEFSHGIKA